jgi:hypothetical protein
LVVLGDIAEGRRQKAAFSAGVGRRQKGYYWYVIVEAVKESPNFYGYSDNITSPF